MSWIRRNKMWFSAVLALILFGASSVFYFQNAKGSKADDTQEVSFEVKKGDLRSSVTGTSQLEPKDMLTITSPTDATIKTINLSRNMQVKQGDVLVELASPVLANNLQKAQVTLVSMEKELSDMLAQKNALRTVAPITGKLTIANNIDIGSVVTKTTKIATVSDIKTLSAALPFYYEDAKQLAAGDEVDLTIDNFMLSKTGVVKTVGGEPRGDMKGGKLLDVEISVANDGTMDAGLKANGSVVKGGRTISAQGEGTLQYSRVVNVLANVNGSVEDLQAKNSTIINQGELIASIFNDSINNDLATKQNAVEQQKLTVQDLQERVNALKLTAPFDGVFSTDFVNKKTNILASLTTGTKVNPNTQFGGVASLETMQLPIQVDELDLPNVKTGMKAEVKVDSLQNRIFNAEVSQVSSVGTTTNGVTFFDVVLAVKNTNQLKYGMTATGEILFQDKKGVLLIPVEALQRQQGKTYVTLKKADGTLEKQHEIKIGIRSKTQLEVAEGLQEGDKVVLPQLQKQQKMSQQEIDKLRQQFQGGGAGGQGPIQLTPEQADQIRQQFQNGGGRQQTGGSNAGGGNAGSGNTGNTGGNRTGGAGQTR